MASRKKCMQQGKLRVQTKLQEINEQRDAIVQFVDDIANEAAASAEMLMAVTKSSVFTHRFRHVMQQLEENFATLFVVQSSLPFGDNETENESSAEEDEQEETVADSQMRELSLSSPLVHSTPEIDTHKVATVCDGATYDGVLVNENAENPQGATSSPIVKRVCFLVDEANISTKDPNLDVVDTAVTPSAHSAIAVGEHSVNTSVTRENSVNDTEPTSVTRENSVNDTEPTSVTRENSVNDTEPTSVTRENSVNDTEPTSVTRENSVNDTEPTSVTWENLVNDTEPTSVTRENLVNDTEPTSVTRENSVNDTEPTSVTRENLVNDTEPTSVTRENSVNDTEPTSVTQENSVNDTEPTSVTRENLVNDTEPTSVTRENSVNDTEPTSVTRENSVNDTEPTSVTQENLVNDTEPTSVKPENTVNDTEPTSVKPENSVNDTEPTSVKPENSVIENKLTSVKQNSSVNDAEITFVTSVTQDNSISGKAFTSHDNAGVESVTSAKQDNSIIESELTSVKQDNSVSDKERTSVTQDNTVIEGVLSAKQENCFIDSEFTSATQNNLVNDVELLSATQDSLVDTGLKYVKTDNSVTDKEPTSSTQDNSVNDSELKSAIQDNDATDSVTSAKMENSVNDTELASIAHDISVNDTELISAKWVDDIDLSSVTQDNATTDGEMATSENDVQLTEEAQDADDTDTQDTDDVVDEMYTDVDQIPMIPLLNLCNGADLNVYVTELISPSYFWLQPLNSQLTPLMHQLMLYETELTPADKNYRLTEPPVPGNAVCACFTQDGNWYRARIMHVHYNAVGLAYEVDVLYVDYGNMERINVNRIRPLPTQFTRLPCHAFLCALAQIQPLDGSTNWLQSICQDLRNAVMTGQLLPCRLVGFSGSRFLVELYKTSAAGSSSSISYSLSEVLISSQWARRAVDADMVKAFEDDNVRLLATAEFVAHKEDDKDKAGKEDVEGGSYVPLDEDDHCETSADSATACPPGSDHCNQEAVEIGDVAQSCKADAVVDDGGDVGTIADGSPVRELRFSDDCLATENEESCGGSVDATQQEMCGQQDVEEGEQNHDENKQQEASVQPEEEDVSTSKSIISTDSCDEYHFPICRTESLPPQTIQTGDDGNVTLMMSHITSPGCFWVHPVTSTSHQALDTLTDTLYTHYTDTETRRSCPQGSLYPGAMCVACYSTDGQYYRARIMTVRRDDDGPAKVHVFYVDFGNDEWLSAEKLYTLQPQFSCLPAQAIPCTLANLHPLNSNKVGEWSQKAVAAFTKLTGFDKTLLGYVADSGSTHCPSAEEPLCLLLVDTEQADDVWINEELIRLGLALATGVTRVERQSFNVPDSVPAKAPVEENGEKKVVLPRDWDPMREEYHSDRNSYMVDVDDAGVALVGYKSGNDRTLCRFYATNRTCWQGANCRYKHVRDVEGVTNEKRAVFMVNDLENCLPLPAEGGWVVMEISAFYDPGHFFAFFPFGTKSVLKLIHEEVTSLPDEGYEGSTTTMSETMERLTENMNEHYNKVVRRDCDMIVYATTEIVAARFTADDRWYRAKVVESDPDQNRVKVFYVDFGNCEWLDESRVRQIQPQFLHLSFQAVECFLPLLPVADHVGSGDAGRQEDGCWSQCAKDFFAELTEGKVLFAHILAREANNTITVSLYNTESVNDININTVMVECGYARLKTIPSGTTSAKKTSEPDQPCYVPG